MNKYDYIDYCLNILAFDNIKPQLSIADRSYLHKERCKAIDLLDNTNVEYIQPPSNRVKQLGALIQNAKWQRPNLKYNEYRVLEVYSDTHFCWQKFIPEQYI